LLDTEGLRLVAAVVLLSPYVPLVFMGEEYAERAPFPFFVDHSDPDLLRAVREGRAAEMRGIGYEAESLDPTDPSTFEIARLDLELRNVGDHARVWATYRGLLELRRTHPALGRAVREGNCADVPWPGVLRVMRTGGDGDRLVALFNFRAEPVDVSLPLARLKTWKKVTDSASDVLGGRGRMLAEEVVGGSSFALDPSAFCGYGS
jgi:maltooligosyltrehalose trehalohydrolase